MKKKLLTVDEVLQRLERAIAEAGSAKLFVEKANKRGFYLAEQYVSAIRRRKADISPAILAPLGLKRVVLFEEVMTAADVEAALAQGEEVEIEIQRNGKLKVK